MYKRQDGTLLKYSVSASVGGKLAQIGQRLIDTAANKLADQFFGKFNDILSQDDSPQPKAIDLQDNSSGLSPKIWITSLAILSILSIVLWYFLGQI